MTHTVMPGTDEELKKGMATAYLGIDPTADSLHIGHLVGVMILRHFQRAGHRPIALVGGATGMIGDPSMKSQERKLIDEETLRHNQECIKAQLSKFLDFESDAPNAALLVNNYDWMKDFSFLGFIRDVGKHITVNYMMAKDSVKKRLSGESREGMSFTEFSYQLLQGYDFLHLYEKYGCHIQLGGSDQWGNMTTGTELIRRITGEENVYAITCPLITKADGGKFGKTESGNVWLDPKRTSPYKFYQFWLNVSDDDAAKYIKIFTTLGEDEINALIAQQAVEASQILFSNKAGETLHNLDEKTLLDVFEGVPTFEVSRQDIENGIKLADLIVEKAPVFPSKGELRKLAQGGGLSVNKTKVADAYTPVTPDMLLNDKYILIQKGKKNYYLLIAK